MNRCLEKGVGCCESVATLRLCRTILSWCPCQSAEGSGITNEPVGGMPVLAMDDLSQERTPSTIPVRTEVPSKRPHSPEHYAAYDKNVGDEERFISEVTKDADCVLEVDQVTENLVGECVVGPASAQKRLRGGSKFKQMCDTKLQPSLHFTKVDSKADVPFLSIASTLCANTVSLGVTAKPAESLMIERLSSSLGPGWGSFSLSCA